MNRAGAQVRGGGLISHLAKAERGFDSPTRYLRSGSSAVERLHSTSGSARKSDVGHEQEVAANANQKGTSEEQRLGSNPAPTAEILTPIAPFEPEQDEIDELESIPVLDTEPETEKKDDDERGSCHLAYELHGKTLCGAVSSLHISVDHYRPGPNCHSCGKRRCQKCVAMLRIHNG